MERTNTKIRWHLLISFFLCAVAVGYFGRDINIPGWIRVAVVVVALFSAAFLGIDSQRKKEDSELNNGESNKEGYR